MIVFHTLHGDKEQWPKHAHRWATNLFKGMIPTVTQAQDSIQQVKQLKVDSHQHCLCIRPPRVRDAS